MKNYAFNTLKTIFIVVFALFNSCSKDSEHIVENTIKGTVKNQLNQKPVHPAYIIYDNELLATTNEDGNFEITSLKAGNYSLICSAINFGDKVVQVVVEDEKILNNDFYLTPDESMGKLIGEFQDKILLDESFINNPEKADWNAEQIHDGVSGATIQVKNKPVPNVMSHVFLEDSILAEADEYGQYWFELQSGTYPLMAVSEGYVDQLRIIRVETDSLFFVNFILERK